MEQAQRVASRSIRRAAIVYKPTELDGWPTDPRHRQAQQEHQRTLGEVVRQLRRLGVPYDPIQRFQRIREHRYDLVVTVGGDGTVLTTAHQVSSIPVLAVNSAPRFSEGFLAAVDRRGFAGLLRAVLEGGVPPVAVHRLALRLNGRLLSELVLNDLLIAESNPAMISRYALTVGGRTEVQRSSGVWVATAAGSTAAIRSAGGRVLPLRSTAFQYVVREPYAGRGDMGSLRLLRGCVAPPAAVRFRSLMHRGMIFIDGAHVRHPFRYGDRLAIRSVGSPLWMVGIRR